MTDSNAVAVQDVPVDLSMQLEQRRSYARNLDLQVSRKEAELRRAKEEQVLLKELRTVNEMTLRKKQQLSAEKGSGHLKISPEALVEVMALEDEIKIENKRTVQLQDAANTTSQQMEQVENAVAATSSRIALVKQSTGWDRPGVNPQNAAAATNEWLECKNTLTALHEEQSVLRGLTETLSARIEELSNQLAAQEEKGGDLAQAQETLREKYVEYEALLEQLKSMERLSKKKERLLDANSGKQVDEYKVLKQMEGDKKCMYNNLSKLRETNVSNSKSILSLEVRLRQLETKLEAVNLFLQQVFDGEPGEEEAMEDVPEDATEVPLEQFESLCGELDMSRQLLIQRDDRINDYDAKVEQLERKTSILQNAIASRATSAQIQLKGKEKEFETLMTHVDFMKTEFDEEYAKLSRENATLRSKISQM